MQNIFRTPVGPCPIVANRPVTPRSRLFVGKTTVLAISSTGNRRRMVRNRLRARLLFRG